MLAVLAAFLMVAVVGLQAFIDPLRRQPAIEPQSKNTNKLLGTVGNTGAALPFAYTLGALSGFRQIIAGLLWVRSDAFFHQGNYDAILPLIRLITWMDPNWLDPYATGAWHMMYNFTDTDQRSDRRYLPAGMALLREGIDNNSTTYDMYKEAGWNSFDKIKDYAESAKYYADAEKNDPNFDITQVGHPLAHCYERMGETDKAIAQWEDCIRRHKALLDDPKVSPDVKARNQQSYNSAVTNLNLLRERAAVRGKDTQPPVDADFHVKVVRTKPRVLEVSGTWNLVGAKNWQVGKGILVQGPVDGARVEVRLQDAGYVMPQPKEFSFDVDESVTIMQDALSVRGGREVKKGNIFAAQKQQGGSLPKQAETVGVYGFPPKESEGLGVPLDKALAGAAPISPTGQAQIATIAYPLPYQAKDDDGAVKKQYTPQEVAALFTRLKTDTAKIADLVKQGYSVATRDAYAPGTYKREIDMSKDPKMYSFSRDKFEIIVTANPRQTPDFVKDRIGVNGEGLTDKRYLDTTTIPGVRQIRRVITVSREDLTGSGSKVLAE